MPTGVSRAKEQRAWGSLQLRCWAAVRAASSYRLDYPGQPPRLLIPRASHRGVLNPGSVAEDGGSQKSARPANLPARGQVYSSSAAGKRGCTSNLFSPRRRSTSGEVACLSSRQDGFDSCTSFCRRGTQTGKAARSRAWRLWVRFPPALLLLCRLGMSWSLSACKADAFGLCRCKSCSTH